MIGHSNVNLDEVKDLDDVLVTESLLKQVRNNLNRIDSGLTHRYKVAYGRAYYDAEENAGSNDARVQRLSGVYPDSQWLTSMFYKLVYTGDEPRSMVNSEVLFWGYFADQLLLRGARSDDGAVSRLVTQAGIIDGSTVLVDDPYRGRREARLGSIRRFSSHPWLFIERAAFNSLMEDETWSRFMRAIDGPVAIVGE